jgi:hypothetical protein
MDRRGMIFQPSPKETSQETQQKPSPKPKPKPKPTITDYASL